MYVLVFVCGRWPVVEVLAEGAPPGLTNLFNHPPAICIEILPKRQEPRFHAFFTCNIGKIAPTGARHLKMHQ